MILTAINLIFRDVSGRLLVVADAAPLVFDLCPVIQHNDPEHGQITIGIVPGSMYYVAEKCGLAPETLLGKTLAVSLTDASEMMRNDTFYHFKNGYFNRAKVRRDPSVLDTEPYYKWLSHFERFLRNKAAGEEPMTQDYHKPGPFFLGAQMCYADVAVYDTVMGMWAMDLFDEAAGRAKSPLLCALIEAVANSPGLEEYEEKRGTANCNINAHFSRIFH